MARRNRRDRDGGNGFTLIEVLVVLSVVAALAAILTPVVVRYVDDARNQQATSDVKVVGSALGQFYRDVGKGPIGTAGDVDILYSPGNAPTVSTTPAWPSDPSASVDSAEAMADHLISNAAGYDSSPPSGVRPAQGVFWQGPYMSEVRADPWGNMYVAWVHGFATGADQAVYVVSAGPDGTLETAPAQSQTGELSIGGDDIAFRVR